jgi:hypothetical protein
MPRFVVLEHDHPFLHWDLMLETGSVLRTWRLAAPPQPAAPVEATPLGDHRPIYLDYEGPVSGGRGTVTRWDSGTYDWIEERPERLEVRLEGIRLRGRLLLERTGATSWRARVD